MTQCKECNDKGWVLGFDSLMRPYKRKCLKCKGETK